MLFGPPLRMHAEVRAAARTRAADDDAFLALEHAGGAVSHLWTSAVAAAPGPRFRVLGSRAAYVKQGLDGQEDALRDGGDPAAPDWGQEPPEAWGPLGAGDEGRPVETVPGDYPRFYALLRDALLGDAPLPVDPADAVAVLELLEAAAAAGSPRRRSAPPGRAARRSPARGPRAGACARSAAPRRARLRRAASPPSAWRAPAA